jgi:CCR4-NOT transcription complex subunit 2
MFASSNAGANSQSDGSAVSGATAAPYMTIQSILESIQTVPGCLQVGPRQPNDPKMMAKYGLMGLLESIQQIKQSDSTLLLGTDLPSLGLNLSSENLYLNFDTPFDAADSKEPKFTIPPFYMMNIPQNVKQENIAKFSIETLFYIFYQMPRDIMQVRAALELYRRQWLYHGELKLWMRLRAPAELERDAPNVQFMHFDTSDWKEKYYLGPRDILMRGMLTEEEIRAPSQQRPANVNPAGVSPSPNPNGVGGL